ncbi:hypothetical protein O181_129411, partial [Austropuccinia psidii MF-1]|nr:hypothetical protein [Austropuccinia psidii MF-1]
SENVLRQENIEKSSTVTRIIPASNVIVTQNNQPEPIPSELISLDISNTPHKAKNLANNQEPAITPQEAPRKVIDVIMAEANQSQKDKAQRVPDPCRSVEKLHEFLPDCEKLPGPYQNLQVTQWMASIDGKEEHDALNSRIEEKQHSTTQKSAKNSPSGQQQQSQCEKHPQAQNKGKGKAPATKPYSQSYRIPWKRYFRWPAQ